MVALRLALGATTGGLTLGALTAAHTGAVLLGTRGGLQVVHLQDFVICHNQSTSSTVTR